MALDYLVAFVAFESVKVTTTSVMNRFYVVSLVFWNQLKVKAIEYTLGILTGAKFYIINIHPHDTRPGTLV